MSSKAPGSWGVFRVVECNESIFKQQQLNCIKFKGTLWYWKIIVRLKNQKLYDVCTHTYL